MEFQLSLWQTLAANVSADSPILSLIVVGTQLVFPIIMFVSLRSHPKIRNIVIALCIVATLGFFIYPIYGNGWKITGEQLNMNAYGTSATINIADIKMNVIDVDSQWAPVRRDMGAGLPGLLAGRCTMDNGKKALVFYYQNQGQMLLIEAKDKYYIIAQPGIERLYGELLRLGAKRKEFGR